MAILIANNQPAHYIRLGIGIHLTVQQNRVQLLVVFLSLTRLFIISRQRVHGHRIVWLSLQDLLVDVVGLLVLLFLQIGITQNDHVPIIGRELICQALQLSHCLLCLPLLIVNSKFLHGDLFVLAKTQLQFIEYLDRFLEISLSVIYLQ